MEKEEVNQETMYHDYVFGKQTIKQISEKYGISKSTVQRRFKAIHSEIIISKDKEIVVLMDTTYWDGILE